MTLKNSIHLVLRLAMISGTLFLPLSIPPRHKQRYSSKFQGRFQCPQTPAKNEVRAHLFAPDRRNYS